MYTPGGLGSFLDDLAAAAASNAGNPASVSAGATTAAPPAPPSPSASVPASLPLLADPLLQKLLAKHTAVELVDSEERGRGLVASRDLAPGTLVLAEPPWAAVPQPQYAMQVCHHCFGILTQEKGPRQCQRCTTVVWCSAACAHAAQAGHDAGECAVLQQHPKGSRAGLHGLRMFVKLATAPKETQDAMAAHRPRSAAEVTDKGTIAMAKGIAAALPTAASAAPGSGKATATATAAASVAELANLISNVNNNSFFVTDVEGRRLGSAYYGAAALLNHSCSPNAIAGFTDGAIEVRTSKMVPKGSELFISYTELYRPSGARRHDLLSKKKFVCGCSRCEADSAAIAAESTSAYACAVGRCPGHACLTGSGGGDGDAAGAPADAAPAPAPATSTRLKCDLCEAARSDTPVDLERVAADLAQARQTAGVFLGQGAWARCVDVLAKALKKSNGKLHTLHFERYESHVMLADALAHIKPVQHDQLSTHARLALHCMENVYGTPCINPRAASMALILGDCWMAKEPANGPTLENAGRAYSKAASILKTAWGARHAATKDAEKRQKAAAIKLARL